MKAGDLKDGDLVKLKSGGVWMTVEANVRTDGIVATVWHDSLGVPHRDAFHPDALIVPTEDDRRVWRAARLAETRLAEAAE